MKKDLGTMTSALTDKPSRLETSEQVKHTPGPWTAREDHPQEACVHVYGGEKGLEVAACYSFHHLTHAESYEQSKADARLIAAAPEMLAALRELEEFLDNQADVDDGRPNDAMRHLVEVRAAIAKAEGRSS